jgi:hypothetical protein
MIDKIRKACYNMNMNSTVELWGLYGSHVSRSKAVGYCRYHHAALTAKTLKGHECLKKQCNALKKYEDHPLWKEREIMKARKKANKMEV